MTTSTRVRRLPRLAVTAAGVLFLQSCFVAPLFESESPVPASDVRVNLDVISHRRLQYAPSGYFEARFFDKKDKRIHLKYGKVYLNGMRMSHHGLGNYYSLNSNDDISPFRFHHDSLYIFEIHLDSTKPAYICSVRTQRSALTSYSLTVLGDTARVAWEGDTTLPIRVNYTLQGIEDSVSRSRAFPPPHTGEVRIPLEGYAAFALTRLETFVTGTVDPAFRSGSLESMVRFSPPPPAP